ncbi:MAG: HDIG domain-containing protein [Proteobacteria bacterium]|nr:HDIG domain-containing protein [Pseudomonadota bacterium]
MKIKLFKSDKSVFSKKLPHEKRQIFFVIASLSFLLAVFSMPFNSLLLYSVPGIGSKAENNIIALRDYHILDLKNFEKKKENAVRNVPLVFDFDQEISSKQIELLEEAFQTMRGWSINNPYEKFYGNQDVLHEGISLFEKTLSVQSVPIEAFNFLWSNKFAIKYENLIKEIFKKVLESGYMEKREVLDLKRRAIKRILPDFDEVVLEHSSFINGKNALLNFVSEELQDHYDYKTGKVISDFIVATIKPNVFPNYAETEKRESEVIKKIVPSYLVVFKGELLLRRGEVVLPAVYEKIKSIYEEELKKFNFIYFFSNFLLYFFLTFGIYIVSATSIKKFASDVKSLIFAVTIVFITISIAYLFNLLGIYISFNYNFYPFLITFLVPFALSGMLLRLFLNSETAIIYIMYISLILLNIYSENQFISIYILSSGLAGAYLIGHFSTRGEILKSGLKIAFLSLFVILLIFFVYLNENQILKEHILFLGISVILSNILASVLVLILTPVLEYIFKYTTNIKLLELSNQDHPLLKELMLKAPGTYNHSILIGNLVESAARAIKVNPLLARVSAYYHDIGKIKMPEMFVENQLTGYNKHEELSPYMSSLIVASHVKEGIELAKQYNLGQPIVDAIAQHHGTRLMTFFYAKALKQDPNAKEENFRYPGPKPRSREIALLMMADAVEAATRALEDFTPSRIGNLVKKITQDIFLDGQLDECELTLKDLNLVVDSFTRSLIAIHHQRLDYPDLKAVKENGNGKKSNQ